MPVGYVQRSRFTPWRAGASPDAGSDQKPKWGKAVRLISSTWAAAREAELMERELEILRLLGKGSARNWR
jgi:hypothetical protein